MKSSIRARVFQHIWAILFLVLLGSLGYMVVEHWDLLDALFMTVITLTTVGYNEVHPLDTPGRIYTMILIIFGVATLFYILSDVAEILIEANPSAYFIRKRVKEQIQHLKNHQIVCGFGRTGQEVVRLLKQNQVPIVVIEQQLSRVKEAEEQGLLALQGDATQDTVLLEARVKSAAGIVCTLPEDADNTFITLAAKEFNENIMVVCRAANPGSEAKMRRAGAHSVISPYIICGRRMATAVTHPLVLEFLDVAMHSPTYDLKLEQVLVQDDSPLIASTLGRANIKQTTGAMVLAVNQKGRLVTNPPPDYSFQSGDQLIVLGADEELNKVRQLAEPGKRD